MLGCMWPRAAALLVSCLVVAAQVAPASADQATADLVPGPPDGSWTAVAADTRALTKDDVYGTKANSVRGFVDAYEKAWRREPAEGLVDLLEHFSSAFWASFRLSESRSVEKRNKSHSSFTDLSGVGTAAYEFTNPADADGVQVDELVLTEGDYVAVVAVASKGQPDRATLMDQAKRQAALIPVPTAEYTSIGQGMMTGVLGIAIGAGVLSITVAAIVLIVVLRRRRPQPAIAGLNLSPDRRFWWDGMAWHDAATRMPPGAALSPDGNQWWDGASWRPRPPG